MWLWLDRTAMDYTNWGLGETSGNRYGAIRAGDGKWAAAMDYRRGYICKIPKGETIITMLPCSITDQSSTTHAQLSQITAIV